MNIVDAKKKKIIIGIVCTVIIVGLMFVFCYINGDKNSFKNQPNGIPVSLNVQCVRNLLFSKYDVEIKIDNKDFARLEHGSEQAFIIDLTAGNHIISFYEAGTSSVKGSTEFVVEEGTKLSYKLNCYEDYIKIVDMDNPDDEFETELENETDCSTDEEKINTSKQEEKTSTNKQEKKTKEQEKNDDVLTVDNCEDLKDLFNSNYLDVEKQENFIKKYKYKTIEFDAVVAALYPNQKYKTICSYVIVPGTEIKDSNFGCVMFMLEDISLGGMHWDSASRPEYLRYGSKIRIQATVTTGKDEMYIYLRPIKCWGK